MKLAPIESCYECLKQGLKEDQFELDFTSASLVKDQKKKASLIAKCEGVWVGEGLIQATHRYAAELGLTLKITSKLQDGAFFKKGTTLCQWSGDARAILVFERAFINVSQYLGAIATHTKQLVNETNRIAKIKKMKAPRVCLTRKTLPFYRDLSIYAVICGGGYPHRVSLGGGVLIKENHIASQNLSRDSLKSAILRARESAPHSLRIEVEVKSFEEAKIAVDSGAEIILLDNFESKEIQRTTAFIKQKNPSIWVEVSGGVNIQNLSDKIYPGVDVLSVGALTHQVCSLDFSLLVEGWKKYK